MSIQSNIQLIRKQVPSGVTLVCVSKFFTNASILEAYTGGERIFGESKVQELCAKYDSLPKDIIWHFIGHLQTNKIRHIVPFIQLIHGVDSYRLLKEINKEAIKQQKIINCLLQVHIAREDTKFGFSESELYKIFEREEWKKLSHIRIKGLMGMASFTKDTQQIRSEFSLLKTLFDTIKRMYFVDDTYFEVLSMGMSDDYMIAIEEGSTMIRVGSSIFGTR